MYVIRHFAKRQRVGFLATRLARKMTVAEMKRHLAAQIRQGKVHPAIAAVGRAQKRKQRLVLVNRHQLAVTYGPALRGKVKTKNSNLGQKWVRHDVGSFMLLIFDASPLLLPTDRKCS